MITGFMTRLQLLPNTPLIKKLIKWCFDNLSLYVALGCTICDKVVTERLTNVVDYESVFYFSVDEITNIQGMKKRGKNTWEAKCEYMIAYLIELGFGNLVQ